MDFDASPKCHIAHSFNLQINNRGYLDLLHPQAYKESHTVSAKTCITVI